MGLPRRGGPSGYYHPWLRLSKQYKELRKLIPIYFPINSILTSHNTSTNEESHVHPPKPMEICVQSVSKESPSNHEEKKTSDSGSDSSKKQSLVWNIDHNSTNQLHDAMKPLLIYKSLNASPIHWKCVPQLHTLHGKHCAALCGVIISSKRKKSKRIHDSPSKSSSKSEPMESDIFPSLDLPHDTSDSPANDMSPIKSQPELGENLVENIPSQISGSTRNSPVISSPIRDEYVPNKTSAIHCHYCLHKLESGEHLIRKACSVCNCFFRTSARTLTRLENATCLRDVRCSLQWPLYWVPTEEINSNTSYKRILQEFGPIVDRWCDSCKLAHCLKLGCKLIGYCKKGSVNYNFIKNLTPEDIENPAARLRGQECRGGDYLSLMQNDFQSYASSLNGKISTPTAPTLESFLDWAWVRPVHLPCRIQLNLDREGNRNPAELIDDSLENAEAVANSIHSPMNTSFEQDVALSSHHIPLDSASHRPVLHLILSDHREDKFSPRKYTGITNRCSSAPVSPCCITERPIKQSLTPTNDPPFIDRPNHSSSHLRDELSPLIGSDRLSATLSNLASTKRHAADRREVPDNESPFTKATHELDLMQKHPRIDNRSSITCVLCSLRKSQSIITVPAIQNSLAATLMKLSSYEVSLGAVKIGHSPTRVASPKRSADTPDCGLVRYIEDITLSLSRPMGCDPQKWEEPSAKQSTASNSSTEKGMPVFDPFKPISSSHDIDSEHTPLSTNQPTYPKELDDVVGNSSVTNLLPSSNCMDGVQSQSVSLTLKCQSPSNICEEKLPDWSNERIIRCPSHEVVCDPQKQEEPSAEESTPSYPVTIMEDSRVDSQPVLSSCDDLPDHNDNPIQCDPSIVPVPTTPLDSKHSSLTTTQSTCGKPLDMNCHPPLTGTCTSPNKLTPTPKCADDVQVHYLPVTIECQSTVNASEQTTSEFTMTQSCEKDFYQNATSVPVCGSCVFQIRSLISHYMNGHELTLGVDHLATLLQQPHLYCFELTDKMVQKSYEDSCLASHKQSLCKSCYLSALLNTLYESFLLNHSSVPSSSFGTQVTGDFLLPTGGPLIPTHVTPRPSNSQRSLLECQQAASCVSSFNKESVPCVCCHMEFSGRMNFYHLPNADSLLQSICSGCLWTFRSALFDASSSRTFRCTSNRLLSAAKATDASVHLLSPASRRHLADIGRLGYALSRCCTHSPENDVPMWLQCPGCTVRRCYHLLHCRLPIRLPSWYRRHLKLLEKTKLLEDLDPRLLWPASFLSKSNLVGGNASEKYLLVDVEYTQSMIERWLLPPQIPHSNEDLNDDVPIASTASSDGEDSEASLVLDDDEALSAVSSGISAQHSILTIADHESEYGGDHWWDVDIDTDMETQQEEQDDNESGLSTEPETDEVGASKFTMRSPVVTPTDLIEPETKALADEQLVVDTESDLCGTDVTSVLQSQSRSSSERPDNPPEPIEVPSLMEKPSLPSPVTTDDAQIDGVPDSESTKVKTGDSKRKPTVSEDDDLIISGKRRLKINTRFLDDFTGTLPRLAGHDRLFEEDGKIVPDIINGGNSQSDNSSLPSTRRPSCSEKVTPLLQKRPTGRPPNRPSRPADPDTEHSDSSDSSVAHSSSGGRGPRIKQISRPALKAVPPPEDNRYKSTLSAMVHAARLAAVGAKIPGGTSPNHAALAATARTYRADASGFNLSTSQGHSDDDAATGPNTTSARSNGRTDNLDVNLPLRCGQCPACCGLIQPCGRCQNCRLLQASNHGKFDRRAKPCTELICFRRRPNQSSSKSGPRVKVPTNYPSPSGTSKNSQSTDGGSSLDPKLATSNPLLQQQQPQPTSLLDTVPGLAEQLEMDAWITPSSGTNSSTTSPQTSKLLPAKHYFRSSRRPDSIHVRSDRPLTPIPGGDLGMRFGAGNQVQIADADQDRLRPAEGEIVTSELAHKGGYAVVTTLASAPPKEICYACGSGGGQLLFCVSCAEPFHFFCVERQFRPRRKDHFICRNCTECRKCKTAAADLRCIRCSAGYHPCCLSNYPPAQSGHRGNWTCPQCASCLHCGVKPCRILVSSSNDASTAEATKPDLNNLVAWSEEPTKCAACSSAESKGDVCPECGRAYLASAKQMIQCDTCQLWMHRSCTKLTADEYEWIARLPPGQLSKFVVNCSICLKEKDANRHEMNGHDMNEGLGDGASRLRTIAKETLMERMADLVSSCRRSNDSDSPLSPTRSRDSCSSLSPPLARARHISGGSDSSRYRRIPQFDGTLDSQSDDEMPTTGKALSYRLACIPAADALVHDQWDTSSRHSNSSTSSAVSHVLSRKSSTTKSRRDDSLHHRSSNKQKSRDSLCISPPVKAPWMVEHENDRLWTTPRSLVYRILMRILHRLSSYPVNSPFANTLRQLIRWLTMVVESMFPWLNLTDMIAEVRDVLRQANGEFNIIVKHFERWSLIEMHELLCPYVARLVNDLNVKVAGQSIRRNWSDLGIMNSCLSTSIDHLRAHHPHAIMDRASVSKYSSTHRLPEIKLLSLAKACLQHDPESSSVCPQPRQVESLENMRMENREERWVEYWSEIEEHLVLEKFQRYLVRQTRCMSRKVTNGTAAVDDDDNDDRSDPKRSLVDVKSSNPCHTATTTTTLSLDDVFNDMNSILAAEEGAMHQTAVTHDVSFPEPLTMGDLDLQTPYDDDGSGGKLALGDSSSSSQELDRFYFALDEFWTAAMGSGNMAKMNKDDGNAVKLRKSTMTTRAYQHIVDSERDKSSDDEDSRCCLLCGHHGDNNIEGRLLFTGADTWVHVNCALWSNEVYEEEDGQLIGLANALRRARSIACSDCRRYGATMICSNSHESVCTLYTQPWLPPSIDNASQEEDYDEDEDDEVSGVPFKNNPILPSFKTDECKAIHFACALRRRPPAPRSIFTADRSWFCSPECHQMAMRQRLADAIHSLRLRKQSRNNRGEREMELDGGGINKNDYAMLENTVTDDLEPISLGELLVCRRVFVPSNCFIASLYPLDQTADHYFGPDNSPAYREAIKEAVSNLAVSPNSSALLRGNGLPSASLVITVGSLRVDRLGQVREASDSLISDNQSYDKKQCEFLCPVNYRARRIYWSCTKLDERTPYTLHVRQMHSANNKVFPASDQANNSNLTRFGSGVGSALKPVLLRPFISIPPAHPQSALALTNNISPRSTVSSATVNLSNQTREQHPKSQILQVRSPTAVTTNNHYTVHSTPSVVTGSSVLVDHAVNLGQITANNSLTPSSPKMVKAFTPSSGVSNIMPTHSHSQPMSLVQPIVTQAQTPKVVKCLHPSIVKTNMPTTSRHTSYSMQPTADPPTINQTHSQSSLKIVNAVSLSVNYPLPHQPSSRQRSSPHVPPITSRPLLPKPRTINLLPSKPEFASQSIASQLITPSSTQPLKVPGSTLPVNSAGFSSYRIQSLPPSRPHRLTTPTKDTQLANQLNGLFQNLPTNSLRADSFFIMDKATSSRQFPIFPSNRPNQSMSGQSSNRVPPSYTLPQFDGTSDDLEEWSAGSKRPRAFSRHTSYLSRNRSSSSLHSSDSTSGSTKPSKRHYSKRYQTPVVDPLANNAHRSSSSGKRRWMEERNKQQELAQLVSKAKQANHARLYQSELEKHARAFRLRFVIENVTKAAPTPLSAWRSVVCRVSALREKQGLPALINRSVDGWTQFGLSHRHVIFLVEQMRGAFQCFRYSFNYQWRKVDRLRQKFTPPVPVAEGCARALIWTKPRLPSHHAPDHLSFLSCAANPPPRPLIKPDLSTNRCNFQSTILSPPNTHDQPLSPNEQRTCIEAARQAASLVAMQLRLPVRVREAFVAQAVVQATGFPVKSKNDDTPTPKSRSTGRESDEDDRGTSSNNGDGDDADLGNVTTQFKRMVSGHMARLLNISVHPSRIHGRGLFALRGFREDELVIEYMGELIRNLVCEAREVRYRAAGVDCYMFRIDPDLVIDATYAGNAARFINHSCEPNCYAKVITVDDKKHIVILAQRRIYPGEELTYDYRFPKETDKLLCNCGSYCCRRYLN